MGVCTTILLALNISAVAKILGVKYSIVTTAVKGILSKCDNSYRTNVRPGAFWKFYERIQIDKIL